MPEITPLQYDIFDLGFNKYLIRGSSALESAIEQIIDDLPLPSILGSGFYEVPPTQIGSGEIGGNLTMVAGLLQSANFVSGSTGWQILYDGTVEFNSGVFRGSLVAASIHIPDEDTTANSFHANSTGNVWWGCTNSDFVSDIDNAIAYILATGAAKLSSLILTGLQAGSEIAIQGWQHNMIFSATDHDTVAWASGTITLLDGTTYSITGANTSTMSALTYIYLDIAISLTALQTTTTPATAIGTGKIIIAVAENVASGKKALFQVFGGSALGGAGKLTTYQDIAADTITANEMNVNTLSAIAANMGSITAGTIVLDTSGYIRGGQTAYHTGTGFFLGYSTDAYKFSIGDPTGNYLIFDGTDITIKGDISASTGKFVYVKTAGESVTIGKVATLWKIATTSNENCNDDTWADEENPDTNKDNVSPKVRGEAGKRGYAYFDFDVSGLPQDDSTHEIIYCYWYFWSPSKTDTQTFDIQRITETWNETTLTWNDKPAVTGLYRHISSADMSTIAYNEIDVTNWYHDLRNLGGYGLACIPDSTTADKFIDIAFREGAKPSYLKVKYRTKDGKVYTAIATDGRSTAGFLGFFQESKSTDEEVKIAVAGIDANQSGLVLNTKYYLADSGGGISATPGTVPLLVGKALSATELLINPIQITGEEIENSNVYVNNDTDTYKADDGQESTNSESYVLLKEFTLPGDFSTQSVYMHFELKAQGATASGKIQKNGADFGTVRSTGQATFQSYNEELEFGPGDRIQLQVKTSDSGLAASVQNFRIMGTAVVSGQTYGIETTT